MFAEFDSLQNSSRVWIYQSVRKFTDEEENTISKVLLSFTQQWAAHGQPLKSSFKLMYHQFIVLSADESYHPPSGCSIDDSVHVMKEIDQHYKLDLFNRTMIAFLKNEEVEIVTLNELSKGLATGVWNQNSLVFNNLVGTKNELYNSWIVPAGQTWLKRYLTSLVM